MASRIRFRTTPVDPNVFSTYHKALSLDASGEPVRRPVVFLSARVHPGESPASFLMHGLLLFLVSDHPRARELRESVILKVRPRIAGSGRQRGAAKTTDRGEPHVPQRIGKRTSRTPEHYPNAAERA